MNRILILKKLDAVIGRLATALLPGSPQTGVFHCRRILVIRPGGIGDAVLLIPVLQKLKNTYPDATIDVLAEQRNAAIFAMCPVVDRVLRYDQGGLWAVLRTSYDVVIDTEQWHRLTAVVARLVRSPVKIGYATNERRKLFTHAIDYNHADYEVDSFYALLKPLGIDGNAGERAPFLAVPDEARAHAQELLGELAGRPFVTLFPGASIVERRWGAERFHGLALKLNAAGYPVVVIGGTVDRKSGNAIIAGADGLNLAGRTTLPGSAAIIDRSVLLVSGDSGMLHIGVGLGRSTVSLFGSGIAAKWAPRGPGHVVLNKELTCSPCTRFGSTLRCPFGVRCLADITVEEVTAAAGRLLGFSRHS